MKSIDMKKSTNIIYFDKDNKFKNEFIEFISFEAEHVKILDIKNETDLFNAARGENAEIILIDLSSFEEDIIQKMKSLKQFYSNKMIIVLMSNYKEMLVKYINKIGATYCIDKNKDMNKLLEILNAF